MISCSVQGVSFSIPASLGIANDNFKTYPSVVSHGHCILYEYRYIIAVFVAAVRCASLGYKVLLHSHSTLTKDRRKDIQNAQSQIRSPGYRCEYSGVQGLCLTLKQQRLQVLSSCGSSAKKWPNSVR